VSVADLIARRAAAWIEPGDVVNLGIGIPTRVADFLPADRGVFLHTENGMLGVGPSPVPGEEDPELVNAGKIAVTEMPGASYFSSADSFAMIRGGHVDVAVLGVIEVDGEGHVANWSIPGGRVLGVGGAMDLLAGAARVIVTTTHLSKRGEPKIVARCNFPVTGERPVDLIVTEHACFAHGGEGLRLIEIADGSELEWIRANTGAEFELALGERPGRPA